MPSNITSIIIIGGGTWALSTALHLSRRGYKNIVVLDRFPIPSPISAGNDVNKIVETTSHQPLPSDDVATKLQHLASKGWKEDPVFSPYYHETGFIAAGSSPEALKHVWDDEVTGDPSEYVKLSSAEDFRRTMPKGVLTGSFQGWEGAWKKKDAGWCAARKAMESCANECRRLGVEFITGELGFVKELVFEDGDVVGCKTADGIVHRASKTILAAGAGSDLLLDMKNQLRPTAWTLCHLKMTEEESKLYRNLPVLFNVEKGFFMEPDEERMEMKICDEHPGYCNWLKDTGSDRFLRSIPFAKQNIPLEAEKRARDFLADCMPHLAQRPLAFARICWCADTPDRLFLIDNHPEYPSLTLACGGSGHGFAHIPSVGGIVADCLEGKMDGQLKHAFRWRPETALHRDWNDTQNRFGGSGKVMDFQKIGSGEWTNLPPRL